MRLVLPLLFVPLCGQPAVAQNAPALDVSRPVEPVTTIIDAFRTHRIVALGNVEFRGNEQSHAFQLTLIRDPRFSKVVNDIIVEFGSRQYQAVMDRFIVSTGLKQPHFHRFCGQRKQAPSAGMRYRRYKRF